MYMDYDHPEFDIVMELIASLSKEPVLTPIALLQTDFARDKQSDIRILCGRIEDKGFRIKTGNIGKDLPHSGRGVCLAIETAGPARTAAENYMRRVYRGLA